MEAAEEEDVHHTLVRHTQNNGGKACWLFQTRSGTHILIGATIAAWSRASASAALFRLLEPLKAADSTVHCTGVQEKNHRAA